MGFRLRLLPEADHPDFLKKCCKHDIESDTDFKKVPSSPLTRVYKFEFKGIPYYYKKFFPRNLFEPIKNLFRGDRAFRCLRGDLLLLQKGFNAPKCMLIGKKGSDIFMVSKAVKGGKDLIRFAKEAFPENMSRCKTMKKRELCKLLGKHIGKLHAHGIIHGDLRWGNVMIEKSPAFETRIWFLDNERTTNYSSLPEKMRIVNLVQMNMIPASILIKNTDRMRFYKAYLFQNPALLPQKKSLALKIIHKTAIRLKRKAAKKAPVS